MVEMSLAGDVADRTHACYNGAVMPEAATLVRRMADGDRAAFGAFYDRYATLAYRVIERIVRDPEDAADVLQDVFWGAWEAAATYDPGRGTPEAWIVTRARSRAIDRVRAVRRRGATFVAPLPEGAMAGAAGSPEMPAAERVAVKTALGELSVDERVVLELAYYAGLTQTEIAARLRQPLGTVKTRMRRGLERLQAMLGKRDA
jgi:RNA polymerase sigma-70 factor (ECF subfamily)